MWFILNFGPGGYTTDMEASFEAVLGKFIIFFFIPLGLGYWQIAMALIAGISAKRGGCHQLCRAVRNLNINSRRVWSSFRDSLLPWALAD